MTSQSSLTPPTVGGRDARIQRASVMIGYAASDLKQALEASPAHGHANSAIDALEQAITILRSIPKGEK